MSEPMTTPDNPPAFPTHGNHDIHGQELNPPTLGMTLRDYFAAKAMQGLLARDGDHLAHAGKAILAYGIADAMLTERNRRREA